jgi:glucokinase
MKDRVVAVDLGGTHIRAALAEADAKFLQTARRDTLADQGPELVLSRIFDSIREVAPDFSNVADRSRCAWSIGSVERRHHLRAQSARAINFPIKARLEKEFNVPAFVGNDANLGAVGEHRCGAGRGVSHMIYMTISTGIGGGIIADNKLYLGARGLAGEVGHQTLEAGGPLCNCGNVGCLEVLAAGPAIARNAQEALQAGRKSKIRERVTGDLTAITAKDVVNSARG